MPIFLIIVGLLLLFAGVNDKLGTLRQLISEDFKPSNGSPGFAVWVVVIFVLGAVGNIKELKPLSNAFLVLVILGMILSNKGFVAKFTETFNK